MSWPIHECFKERCARGKIWKARCDAKKVIQHLLFGCDLGLGLGLGLGIAFGPGLKLGVHFVYENTAE